MEIKKPVMMMVRVQLRMMLISYAVAAVVLLALFGFLSCQRKQNPFDAVQDTNSRNEFDRMQWKNKFDQELWDIQERR